MTPPATAVETSSGTTSSGTTSPEATSAGTTSADPYDELLDHQRTPPEGWTDLRKALPDACFHVGYHTAVNFTGAPLPGYGVPGAWLLDVPAQALVQVQSTVPDGLTLIVYDAYRPLRGTLAMVAWATRTNQVALLDDGYIARRSGHNHGHTVDIGLAKKGTCEPVETGVPWDTLDERAWTKNATGEALENRLLLKKLMEAQGWKYYSKEWWHFGYPIDGTKGRDVPYGCWEPDEGQWKPPEGWDQPGYVMPAKVEAQDCGSR